MAMVTRWLEHPEFGPRFRGTIRVDPDDMAGSLREIETHSGGVEAYLRDVLGVDADKRAAIEKRLFG